MIRPTKPLLGNLKLLMWKFETINALHRWCFMAPFYIIRCFDIAMLSRKWVKNNTQIICRFHLYSDKLKICPKYLRLGNSAPRPFPAGHVIIIRSSWWKDHNGQTAWTSLHPGQPMACHRILTSTIINKQMSTFVGKG